MNKYLNVSKYDSLVLRSSEWECKNSEKWLFLHPLESHLGPLGVPQTAVLGSLLRFVSSWSFLQQFLFFYQAGMWLSHYSIWTQGCCGGMQGYKPHLHTRPHAGHLNGLARIMKLHPEPAWDCLSLSRVDHWFANPDIFTAWWIICSDETAEMTMFITCNKVSQSGSITYQLLNSSPTNF